MQTRGVTETVIDQTTRHSRNWSSKDLQVLSSGVNHVYFPGLPTILRESVRSKGTKLSYPIAYKQNAAPRTGFPFRVSHARVQMRPLKPEVSNLAPSVRMDLTLDKRVDKLTDFLDNSVCIPMRMILCVNLSMFLSIHLSIYLLSI